LSRFNSRSTILYSRFSVPFWSAKARFEPTFFVLEGEYGGKKVGSDINELLKGFERG